MASTTPLADPMRSKSPATRSRPTTPLRTPLRPSSRSSLRSSISHGRAPYTSSANPLDDLQDHFAELSDAMADLETNFMHLQLMHESLSRFSESFASFLYGMNMNAFCVDFGEAPVKESFERPLAQPGADMGTEPGLAGGRGRGQSAGGEDFEATFMTTDSFVENPPSSKASKVAEPTTPAAKRGGAAATGRGRGGIPRAGARGGGIPTRGGRGIPRGSGIARGRGRGRGAS